MTGFSVSIMSTDIGKNGKCPACDAELNVTSETDDHIRWKCPSCERTWGRIKEDEVT